MDHLDRRQVNDEEPMQAHAAGLENTLPGATAGGIEARGHFEREGTSVPATRRRIALLLARITAIGLIGATIWYLQFKPALPFLGGSGAGNGSSASDGTSQGAGFVTFGSKGIKLGAASGAAPKIGEVAPEFTLLDVNGKPTGLSDFRGKTVVMNFWATWCPPCRKEFPELVKLHDRNVDRGLVVLGVDLQESPDIVRNFLNEFGANYPVVIDTKGDVASQYRLLGLPTTYFIDGEGVIRAQHVGLLTEDILTKKLGETGFIVARSR